MYTFRTQLQRLTSTVDGPSRQSLQTAAEGLGGAALVAAVTLTCLWMLTRLWSLVSGSSGQSGGYYVRDRSLGGKTVFIEKQPTRRQEVNRMDLWKSILHSGVRWRGVSKGCVDDPSDSERREGQVRVMYPGPQSKALNPFSDRDEEQLTRARDLADAPAVSSSPTAESEEPAWWDSPRERGYVHPRQREQARH
jgi:hypothetical protein